MGKDTTLPPKLDFTPKAAKDKWDRVEVNAVTYCPEHDCFEVCEDNHPDIYCWSVYLHQIDGGVQCIADLPTEKLALDLGKLIKNASKSRVKK